MDKYKNFVVIEELKNLLREGKNEEALELTEGLDPKKIKDNCDCMVLAEVYLKCGMLGKAKDCYSVIYERKKSRRVAMELVDICIRLKKGDEAEQYYEDYRKMAPNDYFNYIFKYKIDRLKNKPLKEQAASLEELKKVEFFDTWGYELAKLYHKMGETEKCIKTCEDVIIWFGDGEAVDKAKALKGYYSGEISLKDLSGRKEEEQENNGSAEEPDNFETQGNDNPETHENGNSETGETENPENEENDNTCLEQGGRTDGIQDIQDSGSGYEEGYTENRSDLATFEQTKTEESTADVTADYVTNEKNDGETAFVQETEVSAFDNETQEENFEINEIKTSAHESDLFEDEIAKAVEQALMEDMADKAIRESEVKPEDVTRVWNNEEIRNKAHKEKEDSEGGLLEQKVSGEFKNNVEVPVCEQNDRVETDTEKEETKENSPLLNAVEKELGFVEEEKTVTKKGWVARLKERHQEKEKKKQEELKRSRETEEERQKREKEEELEKQRFIEKEKKKDRLKYLEHQRQIAKLASEKAKKMNDEAFSGKPLNGGKDKADNAETVEEIEDDVKIYDLKGMKAEDRKISDAVQNEEKEEKHSSQSRPVQIADKNEENIEDERMLTSQENDRGIYIPKSIGPFDLSKSSPINGLLKNSGKSLEDYFGFFACQKDVASQIVRCLEQLISSEETMNYCIIGEKGNGKKILAHGFTEFMADCSKLSSAQTVWTDASKVNEINLNEKAGKLKGRCLVINQAGALSDIGIEDISKLSAKLKKQIMIILTDYQKNMNALFKEREAFEKLFAVKLIIPKFNQDDLIDYVNYKVGRAGFIFDVEAYDIIVKRIKSILRATEEGALARTEKYVVKTLDNAEQRNGEAYIRQTLINEKHVRSNVIVPKDLPENI